jgi:hypothetical protein
LTLRSRRLSLVAVVTLVAGAILAGGAHSQTATAVPGITSQWVGAWSTTLAGAGAGSSRAGFTNQSVRMIVRTSVAGEAVRLRLADTFGYRHRTTSTPPPCAR